MRKFTDIQKEHFKHLVLDCMCSQRLYADIAHRVNIINAVFVIMHVKQMIILDITLYFSWCAGYSKKRSSHPSNLTMSCNS